MPSDTDTSVQANITKIKLFRNQIYAHVPSTQLDKTTFEDFWGKISLALVNLGIPQQEINDLKTGFLSPEEKSYMQIMAEWVLKDDEHKNMLESVTTKVDNLADEVQKLRQCEINFDEKHTNRKELQLLQTLAKHNFKSKIRSMARLFDRSTRAFLRQKFAKSLNKSRSWLLATFVIIAIQI